MSNDLIMEIVEGRHRLTSRRARLFLCACVRRMRRGQSGSFGEAVELAERFADGRAGPDEVRSMRYTFRYRFDHPAEILLRPEDGGPLDLVQRGLVWLEAYDPSEAERAARIGLWRDLSGGEGVRFDPAWARWQDRTVAKLAEAIDRERAYLQLPILGDALEDAGCDEATILDHCRGGTTHAHGCWVLEGLRWGRSGTPG